MRHDAPLTAVTFDCWNTLLWEPDPGAGRAQRRILLLEAIAQAGLEVPEAEVDRALESAWTRHWKLWEDGVTSTAIDIALWALAPFGLGPEHAEPLGRRMQEVALEREVRALEDARQTLVRLAERGIRRALICDTGYSPGPVVRQLLEREGLLEWLEVQIFSDEAGVPKPDARVFEAALGPLGVEPHESIHVGDLRRTDIAGARAMGMRSIRIRCKLDDDSPLPEADAVANSHAHLQEILGLS